jgi:hypothetical protein
MALGQSTSTASATRTKLVSARWPQRLIAETRARTATTAGPTSIAKNGMNIILKTVAMVTVASPFSWKVVEAETLPLQPRATRRSDQLIEPSRTVLNDCAEALQIAQARELTGYQSDHDRKHYFVGVTLALEEYYLREFSYPANSKDLIDSSYLLSEWTNNGFEISDYSEEAAANSSTLIYAPEPSGEAELIKTPERACALKMLSFREYSLFTTSLFEESWLPGENEYPYRTWWAIPYIDELALVEIYHMSKRDPTVKKCPCNGNCGGKSES